jgi:hypothetical protein
LQENHDSVFDFYKLRRTVIKGLPCEFVPHKTGGGECCLDGEINIRAEVWRNIIKIE